MNHSASNINSPGNTNKSFNCGKQYSIEDLEKNSNRYIRISTPCSVLALKRTGISQEELYFVPFIEFIQKNPEMRKLSPEIQESRYMFFEGHRKEKIQEIKKVRNQIKNDNNSITRNNSFLNKSANLTFDHNKLFSTSVNNDIKQLEQMKAKNELELLNMLQNEVNKELLLKEAERKIQRQKEKFLQYQKELQQRAEEENRKKEKVEQERLKKQQEEEELAQKLEKERQREMIEKFKKEREDEILREQEMKKKQIEEKRRGKTVTLLR